MIRIIIIIIIIKFLFSTCFALSEIESRIQSENSIVRIGASSGLDTCLG
jgi:hypothetical protein